MKKLIFILIISLVHLCFSVDLTGTAGATFLRLGVGPRAVAMGEANAAIADNAEGVYWNPAGIFQIEKSELFLSHSEWFEGVRYDNLNYILTTKNNGNIGFGIKYLYMGNIPRTLLDDAGEPVASIVDNKYLGADPITQFSAKSTAFTLSYANQISVSTYYGINGKGILEQIDDRSRFGIAFDFGILQMVPKNYWFENKKISPAFYYLLPNTFGINVQNIGKLGAFDVESDRLPLNFKVGIAYSYPIGPNNAFNMAFDVNQSLDNELEINLGLEAIIINMIAVRAGYQTGHGNTFLDGITGGIGVKFGNYSLDYSLMNVNEAFGMTHQVSFHVGFGSKVSEELVQQIQEIQNEEEYAVADVNNVIQKEADKYSKPVKKVQTTVKPKPKKQKTVEMQKPETEPTPEPEPEPVSTQTQEEQSVEQQIQQLTGESFTENEQPALPPAQQEEQQATPTEETPAAAPAADEGAFDKIVQEADNLYANGEYEKAIAKYKQVLTINDVPIIHQKLGDAYLGTGNIELAAEEFTKASQ